ncbi:MAG: excinuclease ABC subunit A, partial [Acidobacteria bacterium]|nr:excinuclease ABC subunit A [Acidobacteriota bacterium]
MPEQEAIVVRGARVHNLKNISFSIPHNQLTVVTGVSGSGKSSLAFDTIYAEGQRRYVESLSAYARQFLERMNKPDVDEVLGIAPAIAINQKNSTRNPRSTVATQTEIYDYLRLLFARVGTTICDNCHQVVKRDTPQSIADEILALPEATRFYVLFPASAGTDYVSEEEEKPKKKKAKTVNVQAHLMSLMQRGFTRLFTEKDQQVVELQTPDSFTGKNFDGVYVLIDRLAAREDIRTRLTDSIETCYRDGHGQALIQLVGDQPQTLRYSEQFKCKRCDIAYVWPEPQLFSFNNPFGACATCQGFGNTIGLDLNLVIPYRDLSLKADAVEPFTKPHLADWRAAMFRFAESNDIPLDVPFGELAEMDRKAIVYGKKGEWPGVVGAFEWLEKKKYKLHVRVFLAKYRGYTRCPEGDGGRLRREARAIKLNGKSLGEITALSITDAAKFFNTLTLTKEQSAIADRLLKEITDRLKFLNDVGLEYLSLDRLAATLSGGEAQRIQLATHLGASLVGALYVLDEPSIGLHARDGARLIKLLENLRDIGNTVLVVEHDPEMMRAADYVLDIGPGAGELGGEVIYEGALKGLLKHKDSLTARYLRHELQIKVPTERRTPRKESLKLRGVR